MHSHVTTIKGKRENEHKHSLRQNLKSIHVTFVEFKKELVLAGYSVEEVKGRYGGYILNDEYDLPVTIFSDEQRMLWCNPISLCVHKKTLNPFHYIVMRWIRLFRQARFHPMIPYTICPILWN